MLHVLHRLLFLSSLISSWTWPTFSAIQLVGFDFMFLDMTIVSALLVKFKKCFQTYIVIIFLLLNNMISDEIPVPS